MKKCLIIFLILCISLAGCVQEEETVNQSSDSAEETTLNMEDIKDDDVIADVHGHEISGEDLLYEMKRLELIYLLQGEAVVFGEISPNVAIQELSYNHMVHDLAAEHGITVNESEQTDRMKTVRMDAESVDGYEEVMEGIDEELFWAKEESRYKIILSAEMLVAHLMEEEKEKHPTYTEQALRFDAQEELEEIIQQKLVEADVEVYLQGI
jgi:hypothetical protein